QAAPLLARWWRPGAAPPHRSPDRRAGGVGAGLGHGGGGGGVARGGAGQGGVRGRRRRGRRADRARRRHRVARHRRRRRGRAARIGRFPSVTSRPLTTLGGGLHTRGRSDPMSESTRDERWYLPKYDTVEEERLHRKQRLAAGFRLFGKFGFEEGVAGHITARDPEQLDHFWVNPFGMSFSHISVSDLVLVNSRGEVVEGEGGVNTAAFAIHSALHEARPDIVAAVHSHALYGKAGAT